ncbi:hypothetical protein [Tepidibacillus marianensis]|uniref:hypothetical protein n=1 Tax=Tepidibacillus marianensis TaxID=3131995 RepID=UPI0030D506B7
MLQIFSQSRNIKDVCDIIPKIKKLAPLGFILIEILEGKLTTVTATISQVQPLLQRTSLRTGRKGWDWIQWLFSFSTVLFIISLYLLFEFS